MGVSVRRFYMPRAASLFSTPKEKLVDAMTLWQVLHAANKLCRGWSTLSQNLGNHADTQW